MLSVEEASFLYSRGKLDLNYTWNNREFRGLSQQDLFSKNVQLDNETNWISLRDSGFPTRLYDVLGYSAPPILSYQGNLDLLSCPSVGFCGARNASERGLRAAQEIAEMLSEERIVIVSGNARGVDEAAHGAALSSNGRTIFVLPEGINKGRIRAKHRSLVNERNSLILSEFFPSDVWLAKRAMQRNRTIAALSDVLIVVEAGETGGTLNAGLVALEKGVPLFVLGYSDPPTSAAGNKILIEKGGVALQRDVETGTPRVDKIISYIQKKLSS